MRINGMIGWLSHALGTPGADTGSLVTQLARAQNKPTLTYDVSPIGGRTHGNEHREFLKDNSTPTNDLFLLRRRPWLGVFASLNPFSIGDLIERPLARLELTDRTKFVPPCSASKN